MNVWQGVCTTFFLLNACAFPAQINPIGFESQPTVQSCENDTTGMLWKSTRSNLCLPTVWKCYFKFLSGIYWFYIKKKNSVSWPLHAQNMSSNLTAVFRITCICYIFTSAGLILFAEFLLRLFVHPFWRSLALSEWLGVTRQWMYFIACIDN